MHIKIFVRLNVDHWNIRMTGYFVDYISGSLYSISYELSLCCLQ